MTAFRITALVLVLGLLAACDEPPKPPAPVPTPPSIDAAPVQASKPPVSVPAEPAITAAAASTKPAATQSQPHKNQPVRAKVQPPARPQPLPPVKLDLRLPAELVEQMEFEPLEALPTEPLLPPLFTEKPTEPGPFQLNGRLITNEQSEDYWDSVEGAELQFEFRN